MGTRRSVPRETERRLRRWDLKHFWHPYTQMRWYKRVTPPLIVEARGNYLYDIRGRKFLDAVSSIWCITFGHTRKELVEAILKQTKRLQHSTTLGMSNIPAITLAKRISELVGLPKVFLSEDGSEAVEVAIKLSLSHSKRSGKPKRVVFGTVKNAYHGDTLGAMSVSGKTLFTSEYSDLMFEVVELPPVYCFRCKFNRTREKGERVCSQECLQMAVDMVKKNRNKLCAVFVEGGVQGAAGMIPFPEGYIRALREETRTHGVLLVVDEVATGFGRTGKLFGFQWELDRKNMPDIVCLGKGLSGGYLPVAATVVREEIYDLFDGELWEYKHFMHGHTFTGNPICCAVAVENLKLFEKRETMAGVVRTASYLRERVVSLIDLDFVGDVRGKGFMWGVELVRRGKESFPKAAMAGWRVATDMWKRGVFIRPLGDVIVINPPLTITRSEIDFMTEALRESILKLKRLS